MMKAMLQKLKKLFYLLFAASHAVPQRARALPAGAASIAPEEEAQTAKTRFAKRMGVLIMALAALFTLLPQTAVSAETTEYTNATVGPTSSYDYQAKATGGTYDTAFSVEFYDGCYSISFPLTAANITGADSGMFQVNKAESTPWKAKYDVFDLSTQSKGGGKLVVDYVPTAPGIHEANVVLNGEILYSSPFATTITIPVRGTAYAQPTVTSASPANGSPAGGTPLTITGSGFATFEGAAPTVVTIGGAAATNVVVVNETTITCTAPAGTVGTTADVTVTSGGAGSGISDTKAGAFAYPYLSPTAAALSPAQGSAAGGTSVTITGAGFSAGGASVTFGGAAATNVAVTNDTTITCTAPAGTPGASVDVVVTTNGGSATLTGAYAYTQAPAFTTQPASTTAAAGGSASFTVVVGGYPTPTLQWQKYDAVTSAWVNLDGQTNATLTLTGIAAGDAGAYRCLASNSAQADVASSQAQLKVLYTIPPRSGSGQVIDPSQGLNHVFSFDAPLQDLSGAWMNGVPFTFTPQDGKILLAIEGYSGPAGEATEGSTVITLYADYLKALQNGDYTLRVAFSDGDAFEYGTGAVSFTIKRAETQAASTSPKTGDGQNLIFWICLAAIAGISIYAAARKKFIAQK